MSNRPTDNSSVIIPYPLRRKNASIVTTEVVRTANAQRFEGPPGTQPSGRVRFVWRWKFSCNDSGSSMAIWQLF